MTRVRVRRIGHKLDGVRLRGPLEPEDLKSWQSLAEAELARLRSLTASQLGAEVMRRGFAELPADGARTRIGLSNSLCPTAPPAVGGDDIDLVAQFGALLAPVLVELEDAGLLRRQTRGRSALAFYSLTAHGRSALSEDDVGAILATRDASRAGREQAPGSADAITTRDSE